MSSSTPLQSLHANSLHPKPQTEVEEQDPNCATKVVDDDGDDNNVENADQVDDDDEVKWIQHYSSDQQILLVGEGDFSFSLCLAKAFNTANNIVATSLDSYEDLLKNYGNAESNLKTLSDMGAALLHGVDATKMKSHTDLKMRMFDRIVYNFPHAGFKGREDLTRVIGLHRSLVRGFFQNASHMLRPNGEVHVTHKTRGPFKKWNIEELAAKNSLVLAECSNFDIKDYPGYSNKRGEGLNCDNPFPLNECCTYKFRVGKVSKKKALQLKPIQDSGIHVSKGSQIQNIYWDSMQTLSYPPPLVNIQDGYHSSIQALHREVIPSHAHLNFGPQRDISIRAYLQHAEAVEHQLPLLPQYEHHQVLSPRRELLRTGTHMGLESNYISSKSLLQYAETAKRELPLLPQYEHQVLVPRREVVRTGSHLAPQSDYRSIRAHFPFAEAADCELPLLRLNQHQVLAPPRELLRTGTHFGHAQATVRSLPPSSLPEREIFSSQREIGRVRPHIDCSLSASSNWLLEHNVQLPPGELARIRTLRLRNDVCRYGAPESTRFLSIPEDPPEYMLRPPWLRSHFFDG